MATKRLKRPRDPVSLAKLVGDIATGRQQDAVEDKRNPAAVERGHAGGLTGGKIRMQKLAKSERVKLAKKAARARWNKESV